MLVKITAHKDSLVFDGDPNITEDWIPYQRGCLLYNTDKHLGISKKAFEVLKKVKRGKEEFGEIHAFISIDGRGCFAWKGPYKVIKRIDQLVGSDHYDIDAIRYIEIPNGDDPGC